MSQQQGKSLSETESALDTHARVLGYAVLSAIAHAQRDENYDLEVRVGPSLFKVAAKQFPTAAIVFEVVAPKRG